MKLITEFIGVLTENIVEDEETNLVDQLVGIVFTVEQDRLIDRPIPEEGYQKMEQDMIENQKDVICDQ